MIITIETDFKIGDHAFLRHDTDQKRWMITSITMHGNMHLQYRLVCGNFEYWAYAIEISKEPDIVLKTTN